MAKTKPARGSGSGENARPTTRPRTPRASGAQHRKKARTREKTHRLVDGVLNFANYGKWPLGKIEWLTVYDPTPEEEGTFNPMLASLHMYVVANLESFGSREEGGTAVQTQIAALFDEVILAQAEIEETKGLQDSDRLLKKLRAALVICEGMVQNLKDGGGSKLIYRCITCRKWFVAWRHDPRDQRRPYCGKSCWPTDSVKDAVAPARRIQSKKTKTPSGGV